MFRTITALFTLTIALNTLAACPSLAGRYICGTKALPELISLDIGQRTDEQGLIVYSLLGLFGEDVDLISDGKERDIALDNLPLPTRDGRYKASCTEDGSWKGSLTLTAMLADISIPARLDLKLFRPQKDGPLAGTIQLKLEGKVGEDTKNAFNANFDFYLDADKNMAQVSCIPG